MSEEFYGKSIPITSGFDLGAKSPLDTRSIVKTIEERNAHVTGNRAYEGMKVYVLAEKKEYRYNGNDWEEVGGITDEQLEKLTIAYEHSQTPHVTEEYVDTKIADTNGYINEMLGGKKLVYLTQAEYDILTEEEKNNENIVYNITDIDVDYVTEEELNNKEYATQIYVSAKIAEAQLSGGEVDLSAYATKDDLKTKIDYEIDVGSGIELGEGVDLSNYATLEQVDEKISQSNT